MSALLGLWAGIFLCLFWQDPGIGYWLAWVTCAVAAVIWLE